MMGITIPMAPEILIARTGMSSSKSTNESRYLWTTIWRNSPLRQFLHWCPTNFLRWGTMEPGQPLLKGIITIDPASTQAITIGNQVFTGCYG